MNRIRRNWVWVLLAAVLAAVGWIQVEEWKVDVSTSDIYYHYLDGEFLQHNVNPYARVLEGDMSQNNKYTTILPAFPIASYLTQHFLPLNEFQTWVGFWRWVFLLANLGTLTLIFLACRPRENAWLAVLMPMVYGLNRWTLGLYHSTQMDPLPIFFLALALYLFPRQRWWSLAFLSLSLAIKQMAVFIVPLFLLEVILERQPGDSVREVARRAVLSSAMIAAVPVLCSLPFLVWNWKGLILSILFSTTRTQYQGYVLALSIEHYLGWTGFSGRIPMLVMFALIYLAAWRMRMKFYLSAMLSMLVFVCFNPILFTQYVPWFMVIVPFAILEMIKDRKLYRARFSPSSG